MNPPTRTILELVSRHGDLLVPDLRVLTLVSKYLTVARDELNKRRLRDEWGNSYYVGCKATCYSKHDDLPLSLGETRVEQQAKLEGGHCHCSETYCGRVTYHGTYWGEFKEGFTSIRANCVCKCSFRDPEIYPQGKITQKCVYVDGLIQGDSVWSDEWGETIMKVPYKDGMKHGECLIWYQKARSDLKYYRGGLWKTCYYDRCKLNGKFTIWRYDPYFPETPGENSVSEVYIELDYKDNLIDGKVKYHDYGPAHASHVYTFKNGKKEGLYEEFSRNGELVGTKIYKDDVRIEGEEELNKIE